MVLCWNYGYIKNMYIFIHLLKLFFFLYVKWGGEIILFFCKVARIGNWLWRFSHLSFFFYLQFVFFFIFFLLFTFSFQLVYSIFLFLLFLFLLFFLFSFLNIIYFSLLLFFLIHSHGNFFLNLLFVLFYSRFIFVLPFSVSPPLFPHCFLFSLLSPLHLLISPSQGSLPC